MITPAWALEKWSTVLYSTPQSLASEMKTYFFCQLDVGGFSWMLMMLFRKSGVWCSGIPLFPTLAMPSSLELPRTTCLPQLTKLREGASLWAKPAAVSNPQTAANKLDVQLQFFTRSASCGSCQVLAIQLNSRQAFRWTMKRVHLDVDSEENACSVICLRSSCPTSCFTQLFF